MTTMKIFSIVFGILAMIFWFIVATSIYYFFHNYPSMPFGKVDSETLTKNMIIAFVVLIIFVGLFVYTLLHDEKNPLCIEDETKK